MINLANDLPEWHLHAECRGADPDLFFPDPSGPVRKALAMCKVCPVRVECLDWAITNHEPGGIWGGLSERKRRRVRRERAA